MPYLNQDDIKSLLDEPSVDTRAETAAKVAAEFKDGALDPSARAIAEEIFRIMMYDAEVRVRQALSDSLKDSDLVPHDVAVALAKDVIEVAEPVLKFSQVLTDSDLIEIVQTKPTESRIAVAKRAMVSPAVSDALVETRDEDAVATLVGNPGAAISESTFETILDAFSQSEPIKHNMSHRPTLPIRITERLVSMVSERLREHLVTHHEMSPNLATDLILQSREKAALGLLTPEANRQDTDELVAQLHENGRLTPSIILRALCMGDLLFFVSAMARLAEVPVANAHILVQDEGGLGLNELYRKAGLPEGMYAAVRVPTNVVREMDYDGRLQVRERFRSRMIERFLTQFEHLDSDNLDYLLAKLGRNFEGTGDGDLASGVAAAQ